MHGKDKKCVQIFSEKLKARASLGDLSVDGRLPSKLKLQEYDGEE
jgi:hypothetical protein